MKKIEYRNATLTDYDLFNKMYKDLEYSGMPHSPKKDFDFETYKEFADGNIILAFDENNEAFGFVVLIAYDDGSCRISNLYVEEQGKGYGRQFFEYVERQLIDEGFSRIELLSASFETDRFWEKMGFTSVNNSDEYEKKLV